MAVLYITEYLSMGTASAGQPQIAEVPPVAEQTVAIGGASTPSSTFNATTQFVRLCADTVCAVAFGVSPTAAVAGTTQAPAPGTLRLPANVPEYFGLANAGLKLAVIATN